LTMGRFSTPASFVGLFIMFMATVPWMALCLIQPPGSIQGKGGSKTHRTKSILFSDVSEDELNQKLINFTQIDVADKRTGPIAEELAAVPTTPKFAPPISETKFQTIQDRRVNVQFKYTGGCGLKLYYLFAAQHLKKKFPDIRIIRKVIAIRGDETVFEIRIDDKLVYSKRPDKKGVYLEFETFEDIIKKTRRAKRPNSIVYGDPESYPFQKQNEEAADDDESMDGGLIQ